MKKKGITLIGMPASGKSTIALHLSRITKLDYIDIDKWMEELENMPVRDIIISRGVDYKLELESRYIHENDHHEVIISPPGSVIYTDTRDKLGSQTHIIWLRASLETIRQRLAADIKNDRNIIGLSEKGLDALYHERAPLYAAWADYIIDVDDKAIDDIAQEVVRYLKDID